MYTIALRRPDRRAFVRDAIEAAIREDGRFSCDITVSFKESNEIYLQRVRLIYGKAYCGQHPGTCNPFTAGKKPVYKFLEYNDWVELHAIVNKVLDRLRRKADVWTLPHDTRGKYWIRKGARARIRFDFEEDWLHGVPRQKWNNGTEDQFAHEPRWSHRRGINAGTS